MSQTIADAVLSALAAAYFGRVSAQGPATVYAAFFIGATGPLTGGAEAAGGNYSRTPVTNNQSTGFNAPTGSGGTLTVTNASNIQGPRSTAAWGTVNCVRFYDAATNRNLLGGSMLTPTVSVDATRITITVEAGQLSVVVAST
jgi:hypothetical protein